MKKHLIYILLAVLALIAIIFSIDKSQQLFSEASPTPANIIVDTKNTLGPLIKPWASFAQGGEESPPMLENTAIKIKDIQPEYIRLDHIYDSYNVVKKNQNGYFNDFSLLDETVNHILSSGALPFLSLSYMPSQFTQNGSVIEEPMNWNNWTDLVKNTIEHYSGKDKKNLSGVYYEVWNEPELPQFGSWTLNSSKDYRLLYYYSAIATNQTNNTNKYYFGGPSVGSFYPNWITNFVSYISQNNLRLDFYSWHRYTKKPKEYVDDSRKIRELLSKFPSYSNIPLILTEWGIDSENSEINNSNIAASFTVKTATLFHPNINKAFSFEIKDGPPPEGGKWGLFTHEKATTPLSPKPKYKAFQALSLLEGERLFISGEGTFVSAMASKQNETIYLILTNYDLRNKNIENVPVTITGLKPATYNVRFSYILDNKTGRYELASTDGNLSKSFLMPANSILIMEITPMAEIGNFIPGKTGNPKDKALVLNHNSSPLVFEYPEFRLMPKGKISFDLKPLSSEKNLNSQIILESPFSTESGKINKLLLVKQKDGPQEKLLFGIGENKLERYVTLPLTDWINNSWYHINLEWTNNNLSIWTNNSAKKTLNSIFDIRNGKTLTFYPLNAAIDNIEIIIADVQSIQKNFDE